ncbi:MAG TPA: DUF484 family protein [Ideonella sp.]|uniref:DUF484 family protein n=1 Tax=Ideonella sp. TaxID=1929293 RepID=UPI002C892463|nr:DUF484 family protein [Ideonella sp.]HSI50195.1 DUF484 family protein [Ideonella sp.]
MTTPLQGITEDDIANYLVNTPGFFERHAELLSTVQLTSPHGLRAVSLQERQMEMLRERIKGLERKIIEMIRAGQDNVVIAERMHRWTCALMLARSASLLGQVLIEELKHEFMIPQAAVRVWGVSASHSHLPWAQAVSDDIKTFASSLTQPYCGLNAQFEATSWLGDPTPAQSVALVPLRLGKSAGECFGLLVLGSPDALRYQSDMGTEFLVQVGDIASAALGRLLMGE